jgi:tRNA1(Val) A37 N6-methylase TrmN6
MPDALPDGATEDFFLGGQLRLRQTTQGHRAGTDAVLLAASVPRGFAGHAIDAGAGTGAVGLSIARVCPAAKITLIENEPSLADLAAFNAAANGFGDRVDVRCCDLLSMGTAGDRAQGLADLVVTNPPFHEATKVRASHDPQRRAAHVFPPGVELEDWLDACFSLLTAKATFIVLHHATAVPALIGWASRRLGALTLLPILPRADRAAHRVLLRGRRGSRAPFTLAPPLVLHEGDAFSPIASDLHNGRALLDW